LAVTLLKRALIFLVVSLIAALFGFTGIFGGERRHRPRPVFHLPGDFRGVARSGPDGGSLGVTHAWRL
jgi:hypothetical protein